MDNTNGWGKKEKNKAFRAYINLTEKEQELLGIAIDNYNYFISQSKNIPMPPSDFITQNIWLLWLNPQEVSQ